MILRTKTQKMDTSMGAWWLKYELLQMHFDQEEKGGIYFGIRIRQYDKYEGEKEFYDYIWEEKERLVDDSGTVGITENYEEAEALFARFVKELVMPVHLCDMVDDWQAAMAHEAMSVR